jgi:hypothetical protein
MLETLNADSFTAHQGSTFRIAFEDHDPVDLEMVEVRGLKGDRREDQREPFCVLFRGPMEPLLAQQIYPLDHADLGRLELFLVPVGPDDQGQRYEAVFT